MATFTLEIQSGKYQGRTVRVGEAELLVGRDEAAKVRIGSTEVSRRHCTLKAQSNGILVTDLGSSNGTFINGIPISGPQLLVPGDMLTIGPMQMKFPTDLSTVEMPAPKQQDKLTDDDIASWLTDDAVPVIDADTAVAGVKSDTTVLQLPQVPAEPKKRYKSVAEEAQDIIRRHLEMQQA